MPHIVCPVDRAKAHFVEGGTDFSPDEVFHCPVCHRSFTVHPSEEECDTCP